MPDASPISNTTPTTNEADHNRSSDEPSARHSPARSDTSVTEDNGTLREREAKEITAQERAIRRRAHRKSRLGCHNCKTRRIKCDELKPECSNCLKRSIRCDYVITTANRTPNSTQSTPASDKRTISYSAPSPATTISDAELTYYWTTSTCHSLSSWTSGSTFWQTNVTELALANPHVLHLIFALTALHLGFCRPARLQEYQQTADHYYSQALSGVTPELANINPSNCDAVFVSVQLILFVHWARGPQPDDFLAFGKSGRSEWLLMFRGVRTTLESVGRDQFSKAYAPSFRAKGQPLSSLEPPLQWEERLSDLEAHIKILHSKSPTPSDHDLGDDLYAMSTLRECYESRYGGKDSELHVAFAWLYRMPEEFLARLQRHDVGPLLIYAYFVVLMREMERFWYIRGWTNHVMAGIWGVLRDEERVWARWAIERVGWIPP